MSQHPNVFGGYSEAVLTDKLKIVSVTQPATTTLTIGVDDPMAQVLVPTNATNVVLPVESLKRFFLIHNNSAGAFSLTIKASDGVTTIGAVVAQTKQCIVWSDGTTYRQMLGA